MSKLIKGNPPSRVLRTQGQGGANYAPQIEELQISVADLAERLDKASEAFADLAERFEALEAAASKPKADKASK